MLFEADAGKEDPVWVVPLHLLSWDKAANQYREKHFNQTAFLRRAETVGSSLSANTEDSSYFD